MSGPISQEVIAQRQAAVANLMNQFRGRGVSEKITSEDKFISFLAKFQLVEYTCAENQKFYLNLFETKYDLHKSTPSVELSVENLNMRLYASCAFVSVNKSSSTVFLKGETIDSALFAPDVLQRVVPQAQNERQYNSNN
jgi:hypothetical protein